MNIVQITPGAGGMYCGNCFRDNAMVAALRKMGHSTLMIPLYLPMTLEEEDQSEGTPVFFSGINVYLSQKIPFYNKAPSWLRDLLSAPPLLKWAAGKAAKTRAEDVGELTLSMIRGEEGHQVRELEQLLDWLKTMPKPDVVCLSNALLVGLVRRIKQDLQVPVVCMLQGEGSFLDSLPAAQRDLTWQTLSERAAEVDLFIAPSRYFGDLMGRRLGLRPERLEVIYNGINLDGYGPAPVPPDPAVIGYFARMCREKGLDLLVDAFILLKQRDQIKGLKLRIGGGLSPTDERTLIPSLREKLRSLNFLGAVEFHPNLSRADKQKFLSTLSVFSVPAHYGEAFGLYVLEALASGVPVVQPRTAAFPELIEATGGGVLCEPSGAESLADKLQELLMNPTHARALGESGRQTVREHFSTEAMTRNILSAFEKATLSPA
jgi:glycosyltransferase involved in cell wall biosynthesis